MRRKTNFDRIRSFFVNPQIRFSYLTIMGFTKILTDEKFLKKAYKLNIGNMLNLKEPKTFNEKLQWLKLYDRKPEYTQMVDKYLVRDFIKEKIGEEYLIPLIGVWDSPDDIDFDALPERFVLKCNHNSGLGMYICKDKSKMDIKEVKNELRRGLAQDYYLTGREWPYKNVQRKIIAEEFLSEYGNEDVMDYKVFVFSGKAEFVQVDYDRFVDHHRNFYNREWEYQPFTTCYPSNPAHQIEKPEKLKELLELAEIISKSLQSPPQVRIDFYIVANKIYFGEVTFYHGSGFEKFYPEEWDYKLGAYIILPEK